MMFTVLTLLAMNAEAQEESTEAPTLTFEELGWVPPFRVATFIDDASSGDCDRIDARYGRCIERVDFYQPEPVWLALENDLDPNLLPILYPEQTQLWVNANEDVQKKWKRSDRKTMRLQAELYAQTWEDIVYRWKESGDPMATAMKTDGFKVTPNTIDQWETAYQDRPRAIGRPNETAFLSPSEWAQPIVPVTEYDELLDAEDQLPWSHLQNAQSYYKRIKWKVPDKSKIEPTPGIIMSGRFASRLAVNGKLHDYELMDADPKASGPFFEQLYPYQTIYQGDNPDFIPLKDFRTRFDPTKGTIPQVVLGVESLAEPIESDKQFNQFYRLVGAQVMQFAMQDYTANHMRILASLNMMRSPPGDGYITGISARSASILGETDLWKQKQRIKPDAFALSGGFSQLPKIPDLVKLNGLID